MIQELRQYEIAVGRMRDYVAAFKEDLVPIIQRHGLQLLGAWTTEVGQLNTFHHLWAFPDMETMRAQYVSLRSDPDWGGRFIPRAGPLVLSQNTTFIQPVKFNDQMPFFQIPTE